MTTCIAIEYLSCTELPPPEMAHLAADLGCGAFGISLDPYFPEPGIPALPSLRDDVALRRDTRDAMRDRGVSIGACEGMVVAPGIQISDRAGDLDILCELGVPLVNIFSLEPDRTRTLDQFAEFAELVTTSGMRATFEFLPLSVIGTLEDAIAATHYVGNADFRILVDLMHLVRTGGTAEQLAGLDPDLLGYVQVSDVPLVAAMADYGEEALFHRLALGEGELPLEALVGVLPRGVPIGIEAPMAGHKAKGEAAHGRLASSVAYLQRLLADRG